MSALFACTKCNARYSFEHLSVEHQLCKDCRGRVTVVKCTYCRSEFHQEIKSSSTICRKCEQNVRLFGKPTACEYCNIIAAFIAARCQRCTYSEKKYGPPQTCQQCKQRCAFERREDSRKKVNGKLLCWLCTLSYKRALAKARSNDPLRHTSYRSSSHHSTTSYIKLKQHVSKSLYKHHSSNKSAQSPIVTLGSSPPGHKKLKLDTIKATVNGTHSSSTTESTLTDPNSSDHMIVVTHLREKITQLSKQLNIKEQKLIAKEKEITELKARQFQTEKELRTKMTALQREHHTQVEQFQNKLKALQKQVGTLSKGKLGKGVESPTT